MAYTTPSTKSADGLDQQVPATVTRTPYIYSSCDSEYAGDCLGDWYTSRRPWTEVLSSRAKVVSEQLGHASIVITLDTYSHVIPTMQREAAVAMDQLLAVPPLM